MKEFCFQEKPVYLLPAGISPEGWVAHKEIVSIKCKFSVYGFQLSDKVFTIHQLIANHRTGILPIYYCHSHESGNPEGDILYV